MDSDIDDEEYNEYEDFEQGEEEENKLNETNSIFFIEGLDGLIISETEATIKYETLIQSFCKDYQVEEGKAIQILSESFWNLQKAEQFLFSHADLDWVPHNSSGASTECEICLNEFTNKNPKITLSCQHQFCEECMKEYLETSIKAGPPSIFTKCPSCDDILNIKFIKNILMRSPQQLIAKNLYEKFLIDNFIKNSVNLKWCPGPRFFGIYNYYNDIFSCSKIFFFPQLKIKSEIKAKNLKCLCGYSFCAKCENEAHRPLSCELLNT